MDQATNSNLPKLKTPIAVIVLIAAGSLILLLELFIIYWYFGAYSDAERHGTQAPLTLILVAPIGNIIGITGVVISGFLIFRRKIILTLYAVPLLLFSLFMLFGQPWLNRFAQKTVWGDTEYNAYYNDLAEEHRDANIEFLDSSGYVPKIILKVGAYQQIKFRARFASDIKPEPTEASININNADNQQIETSSLATLNSLGNNLYSIDIAPKAPGEYSMYVGLKRVNRTYSDDYVVVDIKVTDN